MFDGPLGRFAVDGTWDFDGPLDYRMAIENGSLAELIDPSGERKLPVGGPFVAKGKVAGTTERVLMDGWTSSSDVTWKQHVLGPMHLQAKAVDRDVEASGTSSPGCRRRWP